VQLGRDIAWSGGTAQADDERMSRAHADVRWAGERWHVVDRDSRNGTFVDGERLDGEASYDRDVVVRLGHTVFVLVRDARGYADPPGDGAHVVGPEVARAHDDIRRAATGDALLLYGESGVGKEIAARLYHDAGPRRGGPFVAVNCAAIPEGVAERLLFGARKGAFSGATDAAGYFQAATGGTLFLDEIADLDPAVQPKLLRALEAREVVPVGASIGVPIELGIVAASHRELRVAVGDGRFRDDLYYRLAQAVVRLPALRERKGDIARLLAREIAAVDASATAHAKLIEACCCRPWPGNIRELRAAARQAAQHARGEQRDVVRVEDLPADAGLAIAPAPSEPRRDPVVIDRDAIVAALAGSRGIVSVAARSLGLHRTQLYRLMDKLGVARDDT
jgi:DNA-binding NtrC family response regulator